MKNLRLLLIGIALLSISFISVATTQQNAAVAATTTHQNTNTFSPQQIQKLHKIIHDYLVQNPQVLIEASEALRAQQEKQVQTAAIEAIKNNKDALFNNPNTPSVGDKNADVTVVEFFDYQCGHCRAMASVLKQLVDSDKKLRVVFKELPIFGGDSKYAAEAALAAAQQGKYYSLHELFFQASGPLNQQMVMDLAKKAGVDVDKLKKDMTSPLVDKEIQNNFALAKDLKIMGTPTFVIGNQQLTKFGFIPGATSLNELKKQIKSVQ